MTPYDMYDEIVPNWSCLFGFYHNQITINDTHSPIIYKQYARDWERKGYITSISRSTYLIINIYCIIYTILTTSVPNVGGTAFLTLIFLTLNFFNTKKIQNSQTFHKKRIKNISVKNTKILC